MAKDVVVKADKIRSWYRLGKFVRLSLLLLLLLLIVIYIVLKMLFNDGSFVVSLAKNDMLNSVLAMLFVDWDSSWIFLLSGFIFFIIIYMRYRNTNA